MKRPYLARLMGGAWAVSLWGCAPSNDGAAIIQADPGFYQDLSWAPDGASLLVSILEMTDAPPGFQYRVYRLTRSPLHLEAVTTGPMDLWTSWAPDGTRFAFAAGEEASADIFTIGVDGTERRQVTDDAAANTQPSWSPDGQQLAFVSRRSGRAELYLMNANGTDVRLVGESGGEAQTPSWSPDGRHLAYFATNRDGVDEVFVVGTDGQGRRRVGSGVWPSWAPDGSRLLYGAPAGLTVVPVGGGEQTLLVPGAEFGEFSPDGTELAYIAAVDGSIAVFLAAADGTHPVPVLTRPAPPWM